MTQFKLKLGRAKLGGFVSSSLMGSLAKGFVQKVCGYSVESLRKFKQIPFIASGRGAEKLQKFREKFAENLLQ